MRGLQLNISILIIHSGRSTTAIEKTIRNCIGIVPVKEIIVFARNGMYPGTSRALQVHGKVKTILGLLSISYAVGKCSEGWVTVIDDETIIGTQYFLPLFLERQNKDIIYYPEMNDGYDYTKYRGLDINEDCFDSSIGDPEFNHMVSSLNFTVNKGEWIKHVDENSNPVVMNYKCLKGGMVIHTVPGMICKSVVRKSVNHYSFDFEKKPEQDKARVITPFNWSAQGDTSRKTP